MNFYENNADKAVEALREWNRKHCAGPLPESPWDLPKDCPIWHMGLSAFQAGWALAQVKSEETRC